MKSHENKKLIVYTYISFSKCLFCQNNCANWVVRFDPLWPRHFFRSSSMCVSAFHRNRWSIPIVTSADQMKEEAMVTDE